jgi:4-hydroxy-4-methyl-2-oxoglutarate aldolase
MSQYPDWLSSTLAADAAEGRGALPNSITPLHAESHVVGPACVVLVSQDDNLSVRDALAKPVTPGTVLVVAGGGASRAATIGGLLALEMRQAGIIGLVTDGLVRDTRDIRALGFAVWCRGVTPVAPYKHGPSVVGGMVSIGGTLIRDGDVVIADDDGVVIWPQEHSDALLVQAEVKLQQDNARLAQLRRMSTES